LEHGLRVDDVCALKWKNVKIDPDSASLHIPLPKPPSRTLQKTLKRFGIVPEDKGRWSTREVPLNKETAAIFQQIGSPSKQSSSDPVFVRNRGPMTRRAIELMVRRHSQLAGVEANVRTLAQTFSASSLSKSSFFDFVIDKASLDDRPQQSSREMTSPLRQPGPQVLADSFSDLRFPTFLLIGDRDLFVAAYSNVPVDNHVRLAVIRRAKGKCERCGFYSNNPAFWTCTTSFPLRALTSLKEQTDTTTALHFVQTAIVRHTRRTDGPPSRRNSGNLHSNSVRILHKTDK
jgi:hypothetical protein